MAIAGDQVKQKLAKDPGTTFLTADKARNGRDRIGQEECKPYAEVQNQPRGTHDISDRTAKVTVRFDSVYFVCLFIPFFF